jgi:peptidoglycan glycosyltransferase
MNNLRKNIGRMFWLLVLMFLAMGVYFVYVAGFAGREFVAHPFNARVNVDGDWRRGSIYDASGLTLAESVALNEGDFNSGYFRNYPLGAAFAHVVGYSGMSRSGLELSENFTLQRLNRELVQRVRAVVFGGELRANSIETTFNADLQSLIYNGLGASRGAAVVLNPQTGAVLAMVSTPSFDPNSISPDYWASLIADTSSPLLNRATGGLYPPGSTFKLITALAALEYDTELLDFTITCEGNHVFGENILNCFNARPHGEVDFARAMALSCNVYFAMLAEKIPTEYIIMTAQRINIQFALPNEPTTSELIETAIGQGRTLVTPLSMAQLAAAIANEGLMREPFMVSRTLGHNGNTIAGSTAMPKSAGRIMQANMANILKDMMTDAVNYGTAAPAALPNVQTAGKTGTAQNETGTAHSWFIGFAPADNPTVALAIIIENTGGGTTAATLAREVFGLALME